MPAVCGRRPLSLVPMHRVMQNLLDHFALIQTQLSRLHADLREPVAVDQQIQARVELKLTPRRLTEDTGEHPRYQITAQLICTGRRPDRPEGLPLFEVDLVLQAIYQQFTAQPVDFESFTRNHLSLNRQLYPLIYQQLQPILKQFGLDRLKLPCDLAEQTVTGAAGPVH